MLTLVCQINSHLIYAYITVGSHRLSKDSSYGVKAYILPRWSHPPAEPRHAARQPHPPRRPFPLLGGGAAGPGWRVAGSRIAVPRRAMDHGRRDAGARQFLPLRRPRHGMQPHHPVAGLLRIAGFPPSRLVGTAGVEPGGGTASVLVAHPGDGTDRAAGVARRPEDGALAGRAARPVRRARRPGQTGGAGPAVRPARPVPGPDAGAVPATALRTGRPRSPAAPGGDSPRAPDPASAPVPAPAPVAAGGWNSAAKPFHDVPTAAAAPGRAVGRRRVSSRGSGRNTSAPSPSGSALAS